MYFIHNMVKILSKRLVRTRLGVNNPIAEQPDRKDHQKMLKSFTFSSVNFFGSYFVGFHEEKDDNNRKCLQNSGETSTLHASDAVDNTSLFQ